MKTRELTKAISIVAVWLTVMSVVANAYSNIGIFAMANVFNFIFSFVIFMSRND